jgi:hypothetical protein
MPVICSAISHWLESRRIHNHILLSHLRLPQPGGPGPHIYIPQEQSGPCGGGLEYLCLSPASYKRRRKANPVPRGITSSTGCWLSLYSLGVDHIKDTPPRSSLFYCWVLGHCDRNLFISPLPGNGCLYLLN